MKFFFYGTLETSFDNEMTRWLRGKLSAGRTGTVRGRLFAIDHKWGVYPALVVSDEGVEVRGAVYEITDDFSLEDLRRLDAYEEYFPGDMAASEYRREPVRVRYQDGECEVVEAYVYNCAVFDGGVEIVSGDFATYLKDNGLAAFRAREGGG